MTGLRIKSETGLALKSETSLACPIIKDAGIWIKDVYLGSDEVTNEILFGINRQFNNHPPADMVGIAYSGGGDPLIQALNKRQDFDMKSIVLADTPLKYGRIITNTNVENVIMIGGTLDPLSEQGFINQNFENNPHPLNVYKIALNGVNHGQFSYDPDNPNPDPVAVKSAQFTAKVSSLANDTTRLNDFLRNTPGVSYNNDLKMFFVNLNEVRYEN